jgi:hypothetical protein
MTNHDEMFNGRLAVILVALFIVAQDLPCHHDVAALFGILFLLEWNAFESLVMGNLFSEQTRIQLWFHVYYHGWLLPTRDLSMLDGRPIYYIL